MEAEIALLPTFGGRRAQEMHAAVTTLFDPDASVCGAPAAIDADGAEGQLDGVSLFHANPSVFAARATADDPEGWFSVESLSRSGQIAATSKRFNPCDRDAPDTRVMVSFVNDHGNDAATRDFATNHVFSRAVTTGRLSFREAVTVGDSVEYDEMIKANCHRLHREAARIVSKLKAAYRALDGVRAVLEGDSGDCIVLEPLVSTMSPATARQLQQMASAVEAVALRRHVAARLEKVMGLKDFYGRCLFRAC